MADVREGVRAQEDCFIVRGEEDRREGSLLMDVLGGGLGG